MSKARAKLSPRLWEVPACSPKAAGAFASRQVVVIHRAFSSVRLRLQVANILQLQRLQQRSPERHHVKMLCQLPASGRSAEVMQQNKAHLQSPTVPHHALDGVCHLGACERLYP